MSAGASDGAPVLGILVGMESEAAALGAWRRHPHIAVAISGARPDRAEAEARRLCALGCRMLLSWGVAGGLDPALAPGTLIGPEEVVDESGRREHLAPLGIPGAQAVLLLGMESVVMQPVSKAALREASGAGAVDMETHRAARAGVALGVPVAALRAVGDPAGRALPRLAAKAIGPDGRPRIGRVIAGLMRRPRDLPGLLRVKRDTDAALAALSAAAPAAVARCLELAGATARDG